MDITDDDDLDIYESTTPKFIRLASGEDIVAELTEIYNKAEDITIYNLHNPVKLIYVPSREPGIYTIGMMQWISQTISEEQIFTINGDAIVTIGNLTKYISTMYSRAIAHYSTRSMPPSFENDNPEELLSEMTGLMESEIEELDPSISDEIDMELENVLLQEKSKKRTVH